MALAHLALSRHLDFGSSEKAAKTSRDRHLGDCLKSPFHWESNFP